MTKVYYDCGKTFKQFKGYFWLSKNNKFSQAGSDFWNEITFNEIWEKDLLVLSYD